MSNPCFEKNKPCLITGTLKAIAIPFTLMLAVAGCGVQNLSSAEVADRARCPFEGVELTLHVKPTSATSQVTPDVNEAVRQVLKQRITGLGVRGAAIESVNSDRLLIQLPGLNDTQQAQRVLGNTGQLTFRKQKPGTEAQFNVELQVRRELVEKRSQLQQTGDEKTLAENQQAIDRSNNAISKLFERTELTDKYLEEAYAQPTQAGAGWEISVRFDEVGAKAFAQLTKDMAGTGRSIGIFLDNELLSAPAVAPEYAQNGITGGLAIITGAFTAQQANELSVQLQSGALPAPVEVLSARQVKKSQCTP
jgi:preprotein translocase subunit SecD